MAYALKLKDGYSYFRTPDRAYAAVLDKEAK